MPLRTQESPLIRLSATIFVAATLPCLAQTKPKPKPVSGPVVTVLLRERTNATQWFAATPTAEQYGHQDSLLRISLQQRLRSFDYQVEMGQSAELALPKDAVSPVAAQGQLGLGGTYYASNGNNPYPAAASLRTAYLRYHGPWENGLVRAGRFEFIEGQETAPGNTTLAWLQANRMAHRMVGNFGFSNGQRSFDGVDASIGGSRGNVTFMAGRPTKGVFNMNANGELNVDIQYLAYTRSLAREHLLVRGFALGYHDGRTGVVKTDNRALAARQSDHRNIRVGSYGADAIAAIPVGRSTLDLVLWGVLQNGQWGALSQRSGAFAVEGGMRLDHVASKPWIRGGALRSTGDNNPTDTVHNTFFQVLPTPRIYARYPFFNMMNSRDEFVQVVDKPAGKLDVRSDLHFLQLTAPGDFWYQGGGAFDNNVFGYTGRPANGHGSFASLYDISADYAVNAQLGLSFYYAHAFGRSVVQAIYPAERDSNYGFVELTYKLSRPLRKP